MRTMEFVALITIMAIPVAIHAQESIEPKGTLTIPDAAHVQMLYLTDGTMLVGRITEITDSDVTFEADIGLMTIEKAKIREIKEVPLSAMKGGVYWFPNPNYTRLFFAPTARPLKQGDGYFADYFLFFPMVAYGITNNFTIAGGMSIVPVGDFLSTNLFYFAPKIGIEPNKQLALSLGMLLVKLPSFGDETLPTVGILYGLTTVGNPNASLTGGLGYGFEDWAFASKPFWLLGGEGRFSRNYSLVTENWFIPGLDDPIISYGFRFFSGKLSVDLVLWNDLGGDVRFPGWPMIDFMIRF